MINRKEVKRFFDTQKKLLQALRESHMKYIELQLENNDMRKKLEDLKFLEEYLQYQRKAKALLNPL